jgi:hypothetical protein
VTPAVSPEPTPAPGRPVLRVIRGDATPEEIAALLAVVAARAAQAAPDTAPRTPAAWTDRGRAMRAPATPGPGAWRSSAWPG